MANLSTRLFRRLGGLLIPLSTLLTVTAVFTLTLNVDARRSIIEVETPAPGWLPLVAFTPGRAEFLRYGELDDYREAHPDASFLAPEGQEEVLNQKLAASFRSKFPTGKAVPRFEARRLSQGRQSLVVGLYGDRDTVAWYEATDEEIYPRRYIETGVFSGIIPLMWSVVISGVLWGIGYGLWRIRREARGARI